MVASLVWYLVSTTKSIAPKKCCSFLKFSRIIRLILFLSVDFFTFFFAIANPNREKFNLFFLANTVKYLSVDLTGKSNTYLN